jgi:hypothetical protein
MLEANHDTAGLSRLIPEARMGTQRTAIDGYLLPLTAATLAGDRDSARHPCHISVFGTSSHGGMVTWLR